MSYRSLVQLSDLPRSGVTRLRGTSAAALTAAAERRGPDDPVVVLPGLTAPLASSPAAVIDDVLDRAVAIAFELFPAWLPDPAGAGAGVLDRFAARTPGPRPDGAPGLGVALGALATAALRPESIVSFAELPAPDRRSAVEYALSRSYRAPRVALALDVAEPLAPHQLDALAAAAQWLARGGCAVWLLGPGSAALERFPAVDGPAVTVDAPEPLSEHRVGLHPTPLFPPVSGRPHPASSAEQCLERGLAASSWATERHWNYGLDLGAPLRPVRVDLLFPRPRLVVEVDGPEHRAADRYEADRARDTDLLLAGFRVLRLTNTRILTDLAASMTVIRTLVTSGSTPDIGVGDPILGGGAR